MSLAVKFVVTLSALATLVPSVDALACQAPYPTIIERTVIPADASDVALDSRVIVKVNGRYIFGRYDIYTAADFTRRAAIALTTTDGTPVDAAVDATIVGSGLVVFLTPSAPLAPDTEYIVSDRILIGGSPMGPLTFADAPQEVARFTTGTAAIGATPRAFGSVRPQETAQTCDSSACCGPFEAVVTGLFFTDPEVGQLARIEHEVDGEFQPVAWVTGEAAFGWSACFGAYSQSSDFYGAGTFRVRYEGASPALGAPSTPFVVDGCGGQDAEPIDGSEPDDSESEGTGTARDDDGCGAGTAGVLAWLGLGLMAVSRPRRGPAAR